MVDGRDRACTWCGRVIRETGDQPVLTQRGTVHKHAATESFWLASCRKDAFGGSVRSYTVTMLASTIEDTVCSRQVHRHVLRYAKHLGYIGVDHTFLNEEHMVELLYCTHHERLYDATEHQWIPCVRGEVRLVQTIYPRRGDLHIWEHVCDVCVGVSQRRCGWQLVSRLARGPARRFTPAVQAHAM